MSLACSMDLGRQEAIQVHRRSKRPLSYYWGKVKNVVCPVTKKLIVCIVFLCCGIMNSVAQTVKKHKNRSRKVEKTIPGTTKKSSKIVTLVQRDTVYIPIVIYTKDTVSFWRRMINDGPKEIVKEVLKELIKWAMKSTKIKIIWWRRRRRKRCNN